MTSDFMRLLGSKRVTPFLAPADPHLSELSSRLTCDWTTKENDNLEMRIKPFRIALFALGLVKHGEFL